MGDTTFRTKSEAKVSPEVVPAGKEPNRGTEVAEEVPYLDYERENNHPHSVDYFGLGDTWEDPAGGFPEEISLIEEYLADQISKGELANSTKAVKRELRRLEKINNVNNEERPIVKIETLAAYIRFLMETDKIKFNLRRYGNY